MLTYTVKVHTANCADATTFNNVYMKLVGRDGESDRTWLMGLTEFISSFATGNVSTFSISCPVSIGELVLIELDKQCLPLFPTDAWLPARVEVISPGGDNYTFPIHRWIADSKTHRFREGKALTEENDVSDLGRHYRKRELKRRAEDYKWDVYRTGLPHVMEADGPLSLPYEVRFSFTKKIEFAFTAATGLEELKLKGLSDCVKNWTDIESISRIFWHKRNTSTPDYVQEHWREDAFFGYQFLNGVNPILIRRCRVLPENFPVTDSSVRLCGQARLSDEMKKGNIYLCDYRDLHNVKTNIINDKKQYLAAPLVLLHKTHQDELKPIAIQLKQDPADDNPIFLPTDSEYDWLLAKIFVRSADFNEHQLNSHLLRTHLLAEVFAVSLLRNFPMVHPLHKLLVPHTRYTLQINSLARSLLIDQDDGVFTQFAASGGDGMYTILKRSLRKMTYASLCLPEDIEERGMEDLPNYYYRDDGLKLWHIIHRFVHSILSLYYKCDQDVQDDVELQRWISDIFEHGFLSRSGRGFPENLSSVHELVKFVTMVIFTCSAQHSAVNSGQYDYGGWMPNTPTSLQHPPPTTKGRASEDTLLKTLPNVSTTVHGMATMWLLSKQSSDFVRLGQYPEERFTEEAPRKLIKDFQGELANLSSTIEGRNKSKKIPYTYMDPAVMENSVAI